MTVLKNLAGSIALASIILVSVAAVAEVQHIAETGFIIENKIQTSADVETTWSAFVVDVDSWWPKDHSYWLGAGTFSIEPVAGGCFCEKSDAGRSAEHMHIAFVDPHKMLRMTGGLGPLQGMGMFGALEFLFNENEQGTEVTMTYRVNGINPTGFDELAPIVDAVQGLQIGGLKTYLEQ